MFGRNRVEALQRKLLNELARVGQIQNSNDYYVETVPRNPLVTQDVLVVNTSDQKVPVDVGSPTVNIAGTPAVSVSGRVNTVPEGTTAVAGTVNVGNTVGVAIQTPAKLPVQVQNAASSPVPVRIEEAEPIPVELEEVVTYLEQYAFKTNPVASNGRVSGISFQVNRTKVGDVTLCGVNQPRMGAGASAGIGLIGVQASDVYRFQLSCVVDSSAIQQSNSMVGAGFLIYSNPRPNIGFGPIIRSWKAFTPLDHVASIGSLLSFKGVVSFPGVDYSRIMIPGFQWANSLGGSMVFSLRLERIS